MKRVVLGVVALVGAGMAAARAPAETVVAGTDCTGGIEAIRLKLPDIKEDARRQELTKLVDKAQKDATEGRTDLCTDTVKHAKILLK